MNRVQFTIAVIGGMCLAGLLYPSNSYIPFGYFRPSSTYPRWGV